MFVNVNGIGFGELFCSTVPNAAEVGLTVKVGETPVPDRFTVTGEAEPSLVIVNEVLMLPRTAGVRLAVNVRFAPTATVAGKVGRPESAKVPAPFGEIGARPLIAEMCSAVAPVLDTVIVAVLLFTLPTLLLTSTQ